MVVGITLVQDVWFGGVSYDTSSFSVLFVAGVFTFLSAASGGVLATLVAGKARRIAAVVMSGLVVAETTVLISTGDVAGPLWFDLLASGSLIVGILLGAEIVLRCRAS